MAGICSRHVDAEPGCELCAIDIRDVLPDYDKKLAEAKAAGEHKCECGFTYFKTTDTCPLCSRARS